MVTDDFSFPTFTERVTNCIISPPLCHTSWWAFSDYHPGDEGREKLVRESSSVIGSERGNIDDGDKSDGEAEEEKMDMLWEDFNEELKRAESGGSESESDETRPKRDTVELCCVQALQISKTSSGLSLSISKKPGVVVVFKVLKKLLSMNNVLGKM
ncbi:uncharacterized protein LOC130768843 [Actinidia eriantha]|uniref:uncharacterized protein LOC130768843 n=1 Tax=Actinidia eriantha TaxID=165200 RepID=UPI0025872E64|nr:uncharacterized protein LOC130768843 [Actinidia eriantha]